MNWPLLLNSLLVAGTTTALAVSFGLMAALGLATLESRWRNAFLALAIVTLALPPFLVTNCWISLLGETGMLRAWLPFGIYSLGGTIWILSLMLWPVTLFVTLSAWRRLEAAQFECEPTMTGFALLRWLLLPAARGELGLAAVLTFVLALNNFAVPAILQAKVLPDEMWVRFNTQFDSLGALRLSLPLVVAPAILLAWASRRAVSWPRTQGTVPAGIVRRQLGSAWQTGCGMIAVALCALSVGLPLVQIALANRTWTELPGAMEAGTGAIWNSFWFAALAATVAVGLALTITQRRCIRTDGAARRPYLGILFWLPFFVPGVLIGIALIKVFNRPVLAIFYQSAGIVVLAFVIRYFALGWTAARYAVGSVDPDLTDAARLEGATRWQMFRHVLWPQIAPQIAAAWYVVYLLCLWDVESMVLIVPPGGETLALRIFNLLHYGYAAQVNALCLTLLAIAVAPLAAWTAWRAISSWRFQISGRSLRIAGMAAVLCLMFAGCEPEEAKNEAPVNSRFFGRAQVIGARGVGMGEFNKPRSVAVDLQDNFYAVDMTGRVQKFSPNGKFLIAWQMPQTDKGKPKGMCRDGEGNIVVVEPHYQRVNHFSPGGTLVAQWGRRGTNAGEFMLPRAVAVNSRGEFLVSEYTATERVQRFEVPKSEKPLIPALSPSDGEREKHPAAGASSVVPRLLDVVGRAGTAPGEFNRPEGICVDAQDRLYVADSCNHRIQIFSRDGNFIRAYGKPGSGRGELSYPYDITVDADGNQFVCEFGNSRIQVFDASCQPIEIIGGPGTAPGRFANPWGVALDSQGNLYVADSQNHRVQKLVRSPRSTVHSPQSSGALAASGLETQGSGLRTPGK